MIYRKTGEVSTVGSSHNYRSNRDMVKFTKRKILGKWRDGYCLDLQTLNSVFLGYDEYGHPRFDSQR